MPPVLVRNRRYNPDQLAGELAALWTEPLRGRGWPARLQLLTEIHEQIQEDLGDLELYSQVSPVFVAQVIDRLGVEPVRCRDQAHIYANSANPAHRQAAGDWLARHRGGVR